MKFVRKLQKVSSHSYSINIPKSVMKKFRWRERQKLEISVNPKTKKLSIKDWKKK